MNMPGTFLFYRCDINYNRAFIPRTGWCFNKVSTEIIKASAKLFHFKLPRIQCSPCMMISILRFLGEVFCRTAVDCTGSQLNLAATCDHFHVPLCGFAIGNISSSHFISHFLMHLVFQFCNQCDWVLDMWGGVRMGTGRETWRVLQLSLLLPLIRCSRISLDWHVFLQISKHCF